MGGFVSRPTTAGTTDALALMKTDTYKKTYSVPDKTLVWQLTGKGLDNFHLDEIPVPEMGPKDIRFRSDSNGICFSDVKIINAGGDHPRLQGYDLLRDKVVPGHEISITVVEVGEEADPRFQVGDRYIVQADMPELGSAVGYDIWGGMIQYGVFDPRVHPYLIKIEDDIAYSQASLVEPWSCIEASYERADMQPRDDVAWVIGGGGPMGQMHIYRTLAFKVAGKLSGLQVLVVSDVSAERLAAVKARFEKRLQDAGVRLALLNPLEEGFDERMKEVAPEGVSYSVACAQIPDVITGSLKYLKRYGVCNLFAGIKRGAGLVNLGDIHYDQITLTGNSGSTIADMENVLRMTERGDMDTNDSAGAVVGMKACAEGIQAVAEGKMNNKTILYPQLADLPLTPLERLPESVNFSAEVKRQVEAGLWTKQAESEMLDALLED